MALKFSMLLEAIDRVTGPSRRIQSSMRNIGRHARDMAQNVSRVARGSAQVSRLDQLSRRLAGGFAAAGRAAKRYAGMAGIGSWGDAAELAGNGVGRLAKKMGGLAVGAAKWAGAAASAAGGFALFDLFGTAGKMEQFRIAFEVSEGSAEKAKQKLDWISKFAAETPYELEQTIEAFRNLQQVGCVDPTDGSLRTVGDAAAGLSKDLMQVSEAYSDAVNGQFERLLDLGLRATQQGNKVTFSYRKNGQALTKVVQNEALARKAALESIWSELFAGSTVVQSKSFFGIISNITDKWKQFLLMVADAGIFETVKGQLEEWLAKIDEMAANGELKQWAADISASLEDMFKWGVEFVTKTNWKEVGVQMKIIASAVSVAANAIMKIAEYGSSLGWLTDIAQGPAKMLPRLYEEGKARGVFGTAPARSSPLTPGTGPTRTGQGPMQVGGNIALEVFMQSGTGVRLKEMKSNNASVPLLFKTGKSMGGSA